MTIIASFGNFFGMDGLLIFFVLLLLFGAKKLPELARGLGQAIKEFSKAKDEFNNEITRPAPPPQQLDERRGETHYSHDTPPTEVAAEHRDDSHKPVA